jgi:hypothetical protein
MPVNNDTAVNDAPIAAQLAAAGALLQEHPGTYLQTHLAETPDEIAWVARLYPDARDYLDNHFTVYRANIKRTSDKWSAIKANKAKTSASAAGAPAGKNGTATKPLKQLKKAPSSSSSAASATTGGGGLFSAAAESELGMSDDAFFESADIGSASATAAGGAAGAVSAVTGPTRSGSGTTPPARAHG